MYSFIIITQNRLAFLRIIFLKNESNYNLHSKKTTFCLFFQYDLRKTASDPYGLVNQGFEHNEILQTKENILNDRNDLKRCSTNPGPISISPDTSPIRRGSLPVRSSMSPLTSIHEHAVFDSNTSSPKLHRSPPQYSKHGETNIQMMPCPPIDENDRIDRLKEIYINVDQQQNTSLNTYNAL